MMVGGRYESHDRRGHLDLDTLSKVSSKEWWPESIVVVGNASMGESTSNRSRMKYLQKPKNVSTNVRHRETLYRYLYGTGHFPSRSVLLTFLDRKHRI